MKQEEGRKKILVSFNLSFLRQKTAYEVLLQEESKTGLSPSFIIHEALEVYGQYLQQKSIDSIGSARWDAEPKKIDTVPIVQEEQNIQESILEETVVEEEEQYPQWKEQEEVIEELDIEDPYLMAIIGQSFPEED